MTTSAMSSLTVPSPRAESALRHVEAVLSSPPTTDADDWRRTVRRRLHELRAVLVAMGEPTDDWLSARRALNQRRRNALLEQLSRMGRQVLAEPDVDRLSHDLQRLLGDVRHHVQRSNDLAYDEVAYEIGGSE